MNIRQLSSDMQVNSHLERTKNPDFILWTMGVYQAVLCSLLRVFRAVPLPSALTLPLPLNPAPPPASIHGDSARGFPKHLARGFDVRRTMETATGWRAPVSVATVSMRPLLSYLSSPSCQLTQLCVGYALQASVLLPPHHLHGAHPQTYSPSTLILSSTYFAWCISSCWDRRCRVWESLHSLSQCSS